MPCDDCVFCYLHESRQILYKDDLVTVFESIKPAGRIHFLIISNVHIKSCNDLNQSNKNLLNRMQLVAQDFISRIVQPNEIVCIGFHRPPFISVPHLHLHVIVQPTNIFHHIKFVDNTLWFISLERMLKICKASERLNNKMAFKKQFNQNKYNT
jgi:diadenosine tetraphosphate (Ap4A) HIT family hydrolase